MGLIENEAKGTENERDCNRKGNGKKKLYQKNEKTECGKPMFFAAVLPLLLLLHFLHTKFFSLAQQKREYIYKTNI